MKKSLIFSSEELGIRNEEFWCFSHPKGAGTSAPPNATEVASPIKVMIGNAYQKSLVILSGSEGFSLTRNAQKHLSLGGTEVATSGRSDVGRCVIAHPTRENVSYLLEKTA